MSSSATPSVLVHASPPLETLPASDIESLRLIAKIRSGGANPGVTVADWAANGKPYVTNNDARVPLYKLSELPSYRSPDNDLGSSQRADAVAWTAYIDGQVTDLIYHSLYSLPPNYPFLAGAQLASLPFPMSHYVPQRLRGIHRTRLETVGLWGVGGLHAGDAVEEDRKRLEESIVIAPGGTKTERKWSGWNAGREQAARAKLFGEEKLRARAKAAFAPLARKLGERKFFLSEQKPTSLDVELFANLTVVLSVDLPNPLLANYLRAEFPTLVQHHDRVLRALWANGWASVPRVAAAPTPSASASSPRSLTSTLRSFLPSWPFSSSTDATEKDAHDELDPHMMEAREANKLTAGRWLWFAGAGVAFMSYVLLSGVVSFQFGDEEDEEEIWVEVEPEVEALDGDEVFFGNDGEGEVFAVDSVEA